MTNSEYLRRTAVTRLVVDDAARTALTTLIDEWKRGCQLAVNLAWGVCHTRSDVQQLAYDDLRERTALGSQHAVLATHQAAEAIKRANAAEELGRPASKPSFTSPSTVFDTRTLTVFDDDTVSLSTTDERVQCDLAVPGDAYQRRYLDDEAWETTTSSLHYRDGEFILHLGFRTPVKPTDEPTSGEEDADATVLGVAVGTAHIAVTSTARFFSGGELHHRHREGEAVRTALSEVDGRNAARALRRIATREERSVRDILHRVGNGIVDEAERFGCDAIAFGELPDVLATFPDAGSFFERTVAQLHELVAYKAEARGIDVVLVNPEYTRQRCTECGFTHPENLDLESHHFTCLKCGREQQAGYNAAKNVAFRCIRRGPLSSRRVGAEYCALKTGRVTPDGGFESYPDEGGAVSTRDGSSR